MELAKLFGTSGRLKLLRLFLFNQDSSFTSEQVAMRSNLSEETVRSELKDLIASGLLRRKGAQVPVRYAVNSKFPYLLALDRFIRDTTTVQPKTILTSLKRSGTLRLVALSGFFTGIVETQVDLLVVGDNLNERALSHTVRSLEAELGREIRYASFATADFRYRKGVYDRLLRDVFDYPHRLLLDKIGV